MGQIQLWHAVHTQLWHATTHKIWEGPDTTLVFILHVTLHKVILVLKLLPFTVTESGNIPHIVYFVEFKQSTKAA